MKILELMLGRWYRIPAIKFTAELLFFILPAAFTIRTFCFGLYQVPSCSMETTFLVGERFVADKFTYWTRTPKRGEVIAFNAPDKSLTSQGYAYSRNPLVNMFERYVRDLAIGQSA